MSAFIFKYFFHTPTDPIPYSSPRAKAQVQALASYPHTKSIFKNGRNRGFPLCSGSTTSELGAFCTVSRNLPQPAQFRDGKRRDPSGTLVIWPAEDKALPPSREHLWLARCLQKSDTQARSHIPVQAVPMGYTAAGRTTHGAQRARLQQQVEIPVISFFINLGWHNMWAKAHRWINPPTNAVRYPPYPNILANHELNRTGHF